MLSKVKDTSNRRISPSEKPMSPATEPLDGGPAVNWDKIDKVNVQSLSGEQVPLRSLCDKGRTCFIFLRKFDCATCYTYLILFAHLRPALAASNIRIIFISCHNNLSEVQFFLKGFAYWLRELASYQDDGSDSCRVTGRLQTTVGALPGEMYLDSSRESYKVFGLYEEISVPQGLFILLQMRILNWLGYEHIAKSTSQQKRMKSKTKTGLFTQTTLYVHNAYKREIKTPNFGNITQSPGIVVVEKDKLLYRMIVRDQLKGFSNFSDRNLMTALACDYHPETLKTLDKKVIQGVETFLDTIFDTANTARVKNEDLRLIKQLGQGAESEVFKSTWQGHDVAVKYFRYKPPPRPSSVSNSGGSRRSSKASDRTEVDSKNDDNLMSFANEAALLMSLHHRNIITFMGFGSNPPRHFLITEFMPRGSLFDVLADFEQYPIITPEQKKEMLLDTAIGMAFLHSCNPRIIHQDMKSLNLLIAEDWTVKISDFGIAREVEPRKRKLSFPTDKGTSPTETENESKAAHGGTLQWMAPEIIMGDDKPTTKMDIFAFGVICWEVATRRRPWKSIPPDVICERVVSGLRVPIQIEDGWSGYFRDFVDACWAQNPSKRPEFSRIVKALRKLTIPA
ncbi:hypothetical protein HDU76_000093 [Blyttiomyces sp. JEL0837]|nr:hypothetical protein HDU76_000093 [Blyttiomyces sp. JEL0837]